MDNETQKFLDELKTDEQPEDDIFNQPIVPEGEPAPELIEEDHADDGLKPRNRRERRLMEKLQAERESAMFLAGKLEAREEAKRELSDEESDYLKGIERIYGTDTPEAQIATELLKKAIAGARDEAEQRAYERIMSEREYEEQGTREAESELDSIIESIEDTYGVTLTDAQERAYFQLMQKMSPKDRNGEVVALADPEAVWEVFQDRLQRRGTDNRAKDLSARSMVQSGAQSNSNLQDDAMARQLREMGII